MRLLPWWKPTSERAAAFPGEKPAHCPPAGQQVNYYGVACPSSVPLRHAHCVPGCGPGPQYVGVENSCSNWSKSFTQNLRFGQAAREKR
jgi:hypothetical protein